MGNKRIALKRESIAPLLILAALIIIRLYHIDTAPLEIEESWRQSDTESIARNFAEYKFNIFYPNFNYDGPFPNVPALEFQITTFATAILYKFFGFNYLWARLIPICFFLISSILLYLFSKRYLSFKGAIFTLIIYGTLPINVYYSRAIMPEAGGLMFFIGSLYFFDCWITSKKLPLLLLSSIFTALAIMTKPMTVFITIPMFYLLIRRYQWSWLLKTELWLFAFLALGLAFTYYSVSIPIADYKFSQGLAQNALFKRLPTAIADPAAYSFIGKKLIALLTPAGIVLTLLGLLNLNRHQSVILVWFAAMSLELILVVTSIQIYYYFIFFSVPCSILIGQGLAYLYGKLQTKALSIILLALFLLNSYVFVKPMYSVNTSMETQVKIVQELTDKDDLLIIGSLDPCLLNLSDRRGWRFNIEIYPDIPKNDLDELNYYIKSGAKYFIPIQGSIYKDENGEVLEYLNMNFERIETVKGYVIYKLR